MDNQSTTESIIDDINTRLWQRRYEDSEKSIGEASLLLEEAEKLKYEKGIAYARLNIAAGYFLKSKNDAALENLSKALLWLSEYSSEPGYPCALNLQGNLYESFGDYEKALKICLNALRLSTAIHDRQTEAESCSQLGLIYTRLGNYPKALKYYNSGLKIRKTMKDENGMASSFNRIGMIMRLTKKYKKSLEYYNKSLEIRRKNKHSIPWTLLGIASTYEEMQKTSEALEYYEQGMIGGDIRCKLQCIMGSGRIYSILGEPVKAEEKLSESLRMAHDLRAPSLAAEAHLALANHFESNGQPGKALESYKLFQEVKESIQSDESKNKLQNVEISYAIEKSEHQKEIYRLKHIELKKAYDIIDEKNKYITSSINYASRIQKALLPDLSEFEGLQRNCFILYLPKEIVSGDFYWFNTTEDKLIAVIGDCTGHGVPGALMSMLGISFLGEIVKDHRDSESGQMLNELRKKVQRALHQKGTSGEANDGMDISLCIIDSKRNIIQYSGAYNNLCLIRNGELIEYQADRMPIGISELADKNFTTYNINSVSGDLIYMSTDGFADQFGGPDRKKYKNSALKSFFLKIHSLPIIKQKKELEKEFNNWKGTNTQIDDVLILGLKI